jgi:hypothetical protein
MSTEQLTDEQVTLAFERLTGMTPRQADLAVVASLGGTRDVLAEYVWDHWMGEPAAPTVQGVRGFVDTVLDEQRWMRWLEEQA